MRRVLFSEDFRNTSTRVGERRNVGNEVFLR